MAQRSVVSLGCILKKYWSIEFIQKKKKKYWKFNLISSDSCNNSACVSLQAGQEWHNWLYVSPILFDFEFRAMPPLLN